MSPARARLKIVDGYVRGVDWLPRRLRRLGLTARVAFIIDTHVPGEVDPTVDTQFQTGLVEMIRRVVGGEFDGSPEQMSTSMDSSELRLQQSSDIVAALVLDPCVHYGGHYPYSDSLTLEVYASDQTAERLASVAADECVNLGAELEEVIEAERAPTVSTLRYLLRRYFFG